MTNTKSSSGSNPGAAVQAGVGSGVSGSQPGASGQGTGVPNDPGAAFAVAASSVTTLRGSLAAFLLPAASGRSNAGHSAVDVLKAMESIQGLIGLRPDLGVTIVAATFATLLSEVRAGQDLEAALTITLATVKTTNRTNEKLGFKNVRTVYKLGHDVAPKDPTVQQYLAPIAGLFAKTPRDQSAGAKAGVATVKQAKAHARSSKADANASTAQAALGAVVQKLQGGTSAPAATTPSPAPTSPGGGTHTP